MYPDAYNEHCCPHAESDDMLVCNQPFADVRFVDKQEYLTRKLTN